MWTCAIWYDDIDDENRPNYVLCRDEATAILVAADMIEGCDTTRVMGARGTPNGIQFDTGQTVALVEWTAFWEYQDRTIRDRVRDREQRRVLTTEGSMRFAFDPFHGPFRAAVHLSTDAPAWLGKEL